MVGKGEKYTHPARVDRCFLMQREADYHGGIGLEIAPDADDEYDLLVPSI